MGIGDLFKGKRAKLEELIDREISTTAVWKVTALGNQWLCPFCGKVGAVFNNAYSLREGAIAHFTEKCAPFATSNMVPQVSVEELRRRAVFLEVRSYLASKPEWQLRDREGLWYCPFCARETEVKIPPDAKLTTDLIRGIQDHVESCFAYDHGKGEPKPLEEMQKIVSDADRLKEVMEFVKSNVRENPTWRVRNRRGFWVCPFCRQVHMSIHVPSEISLSEQGPYPIAQHLMEHCRAFRSKMAPATSVEELERIATADETGIQTGAYAHPAAAKPAAPADPMQQMTEQLREMMQQALGRPSAAASGKPNRVALHRSVRTPSLTGLSLAVIGFGASSSTTDIVEFIPLGASTVGVVVGDVAGHGIDAAIVITMVRKVVQMQAKGSSSPKEVLVLANIETFPELDRKSFITASYSIVDISTFSLKLASAGHTPLVICNPANNAEPQVHEPRGMALGLDKGLKFASLLEEVAIELNPGDVLLWFSDGLTELPDSSGRPLGLDPVIEWVNRYGQQEAPQIVQSIAQEIEALLGDRPIKDDLTLVCGKVAG